MDIRIEKVQAESTWVVWLNNIPVKFYTEYEADAFAQKLSTRIDALQDVRLTRESLAEAV
ncbi:MULTISPECIES: hypothetical protein [Pseudomonas]|jgi:hypothetical protein|uniref:Uncharacterized protein n=1 Tax=Pseudomonas lutea TaxID=243924 RepID=A0A9X8MGN4_9PSED|nr:MULTISPECIES: hypothetical protein [Pseudomonas]MBA1245981.1 hypothetical protein [Pseudomonas zeshuii]MBW5415760.1 hypothetical protein [Pseudomonas sp. MAG002Y]QEU27411.1 hypothetical protein FOB45_06480 [Pseudomonas luteola]RRW42266.1 hypothetical protein EGJ52_17035 [Pseudomonas luteola]SER29476.1 hypothetical protein SAMN05216409_11644 [Pseudomonas lutea]